MRAAADALCAPCVACDLQGGGFSPKRLRAMLLGVDKRRKGHDAEDDDGAGDDDYGAVPRASARSDARGGHSAPSSFPSPICLLACSIGNGMGFAQFSAQFSPALLGFGPFIWRSKFSQHASHHTHFSSKHRYRQPSFSINVALCVLYPKGERRIFSCSIDTGEQVWLFVCDWPRGL